MQEYGKWIDAGNFEAKERELITALEREQNKQKRQRLYKAGAMVGAGGIATLGLGSVESAFHGADVPSAGVKVPETSKLDVVTDKLAEKPKLTIKEALEMKLIV